MTPYVGAIDQGTTSTRFMIFDVRALFGTMDAWLIWNLTGGPDGGRHVTDVTNAGRTLLMNLETLEWDKDILAVLKIPSHVLPAIVPSCDPAAFGSTKKKGPFKAALPIGGVLGDQQAALFGQTCFEPGEAKNTYGTGCFFLFNTGEKIQFSKHGLLTTPAYQISGQAPCYALEGSIAYAAGLAVGFWSGPEELKQNWAVHSTFLPQKDGAWRERLSAGWEKAVQRTLNWK